MGTSETGDILAECLVHKIFSYLSSKETIKMRMVSKTWLYAWLMTRPNLIFTIYYRRDIRKVDKIMEIYRDRRIPIHTFQLKSYLEYDSPEFFLGIDKWLGIALQNGVEDIYCRVDGITYPFPLWTVLASKSLRVLALRGLNLTRVSSLLPTSCGVRDVNLFSVRLDDNVLLALLNSCPLIHHFNLRYCVGLKMIDMRNLQKITSVSISTNRNHHTQIQECQNPKYRITRYGDVCYITSHQIEDWCNSVRSLCFSWKQALA